MVNKKNKKKRNLHKYKQAIKSGVKRLKENDKISEKNKELILDFKRECETEGLSKARVRFYLVRLSKTAELFDKDFDKATRKDLKEFVAEINTSDYAESTKKDFKVGLSKFYKWLGKDELFYSGDNPEYRRDKDKWLKTTKKKKGKKLPEEILTCL